MDQRKIDSFKAAIAAAGGTMNYDKSRSRWEIVIGTRTRRLRSVELEKLTPAQLVESMRPGAPVDAPPATMRQRLKTFAGRGPFGVVSPFEWRTPDTGLIDWRNVNSGQRS